MSNSIDIFIDSEADLAGFAQEMTGVLGVILEPTPEDATVYRFRNSIITLTLAPTQSPRYADYRYHLCVRSDHFGTPSQQKKWREDWGYDFYHALKSAQKYRLKQPVRL